MSKLTMTAIVVSAGICALGAPSSHATIMSPITSEVRDVLSAMEADDGLQPLVLARAVARGGRVAVGPRGGAVARRGAVAVGPRGVAATRTTVARGPRGNVAATRTTAVGGRGAVVRGGAVAAGGVAVVRPVRPWAFRPYYGTVIAGVTLGTVIAATAVAVVPAAPASNLCWFWSDPAKTQGYWDYCR
jgi:hypothetical protein